MLKGIAHISYKVDDMEKSLHYYCDILGFRKFYELPDDNGNPWLVYLKVADRQFLELFYGTQKHLPPMEKRAGSSHMCLEVTDIHEIADRLTSMSAPVDSAPSQGKDRNFQCWSHDPDGNKIEFMQMSPDSPQARS